MDDHQNPGNEPPVAAAAEPVRSRWTPKPEQILILESIFNSGMVNPPKDETVRIRKLLENFGSVGDANVFYWFQNRRSRSRRRQRQIQASLASGSAVAGGGPMAVYDQAAAASCSSNCTSSSSSGFSGGGAGFGYASSSSGFGEGYKADDLFSVSSQMRGFGEDSYGAAQFMSSYEAAQMPYQTGSITVFINGVQTEVPRGAIDIRAMFGDDLMLVHSSGEPLPLNEHGILLHSLQMGESYYLVARPT